MEDKIRVSFEITDNWEMMSFRNFIKLLLSSDDKYEVFIISNESNTTFVLSVGNNLGLDTAHVITGSFPSDKIAAITSNEIDIHLDNIQGFVEKVEELTDAFGILVQTNLNKYYLQPEYIILFERTLSKIQEEND